MSYTVLARRYRSTTFDEVVGQEHVAQTLKKAIASNRIAHAYLFTGTRGVGKTSMARIMAKALNCLSFDKATPTPCGTCDSCVRVARGDDMDVIEIDAASNTGVDNVRDIIENAQYRPSRSRFKVYIIDEVHMLSKAAFNALLKTMEEPPPHVKFILATTEVEKVLPTILSRCQRYDFRNIPTREIAGHLKEISQHEKIDADEAALLLVAKAGAGSMRDALSLLDRLLSIGEKSLSVDLIEQMLGLPKSQLIFDLAQAIGDGDIKSALTRATSMINAGQSVDGLIAALIEHLRNLLILRTCGADSDLVEVPGMAIKDLVSQSDRFDPAALVQDLAILEELRRHVRQSQAGRALLDATIVRMAMSDQFTAIGELAASLNGGGGSGGRPAPPRPATTTNRPPAAGYPAAQKKNLIDPAPVDRQTPESFSKSEPAVDPTPTGSSQVRSDTGVSTPSSPEPTAAPAKSVLDDIDFGDDDLPRPGKIWEDSGPSLSELVKGQSAVTPGTSAALPERATPAATSRQSVSLESADLTAIWSAALADLKTSQPGLYGVASNGRLDRIEDDTAILSIPPGIETFARAWDKSGKKDAIRDAVIRALGRPIGLRFEVDASAGDEAGAPSGPDGTVSTPANSTSSPAPGGSARTEPNRVAANGSRPPMKRPPPPPPPAAAQRITQEQADTVRQQSPLVDALVMKLNAQIVKIESPT